MPSFSLWSRPTNGSGHIAARHAKTYALALKHEHKHDQLDYYSSHGRSYSRSHSRNSSYGHNVEHLEFELQNYQELLELQRLREQARKQQEVELDQKQKELKVKNCPPRLHIRSPPMSPTSPCSRMTPSSLYMSGAMGK